MAREILSKMNPMTLIQIKFKNVTLKVAVMLSAT
jgi:hypothetical protein